MAGKAAFVSAMKAGLGHWREEDAAGAAARTAAVGRRTGLTVLLRRAAILEGAEVIFAERAMIS